MKQLGLIEKIVPTTETQVCPCCDQTVKVYKRAINKGMVTDLVSLYKKSITDFVHITEFTTPHSSREIGTLKLWGLVERMPVDTTNKRTSGMYKITEHGIQFVAGKRSVPKYALMYNSECLGHEGDQVFIQDCLDIFNYKELMTA